LGAETDVTARRVRWLTPLPLWIGILAGPVVWAADLTTSYALVRWSCSTQQFGVLHLITLLSILLVIGGAWVAWLGLQQTRGNGPEDGGRPRERARFMSILGLTSSAFFVLAILANEMPRWVLHACR
jgi:hypothetical protein